jgi:hypothetical protein
VAVQIVAKMRHFIKNSEMKKILYKYIELFSEKVIVLESPVNESGSPEESLAAILAAQMADQCCHSWSFKLNWFVLDIIVVC